jgi:hypothetical protein
MSKALKRAARTLLQFVAGGGLTALTNVLVQGMDPATAVIVTTGYSTVLSYIQNALEDAGLVPKLLR